MSELFLSVTKLRTYENCPLQFKKKYIDQKGDEQTPHNQYGSLVHAALKFYHEHQESPDKDILDFYREEYKKPDYNLVDANFFEKGQLLLRDYLRTRFNKGRKVLKVEERFEGFLDCGVPAIAVIDRIDEIDENTIEIIDYKTGMSHFPSQWEVDQDLQLSVYDLIARIWFPEKKRVILTLHFFNGNTMSTERKQHQREAFMDYLMIMHEKILNEKEFKPRINNWCHTCKFRAECPAYQQVIAEPVEIAHENMVQEIKATPTLRKIAVKPIDLHFPDDLPKVLQFLMMINRKRKILEKIEESFEEAVRNHLVQTGSDILDTEDFVVKTTQKEYENIDPRTAFDVLGQYGEFFNVVRINKARVDEFLKELERTGRQKEADEIRENLGSRTTKNYSKASLVIEPKKILPKKEIAETTIPAISAPKKRGRPKKSDKALDKVV